MEGTFVQRLLALISLLCCTTNGGQIIIRAEPGQTVSLPCRAEHDNILAVQWIRPDLEPENVLLFKNERLDPVNQHPSFQNRVDLQDRQRKGGDVSLILQKVTAHDTGPYVCRVFRIEEGESIAKSTGIHLEVPPPGQIIIRAEPGQTVSLPCRAEHDQNILAVQWSRPDLEPEYVLYFRNGRLDPYYQLPSFLNRVDLQDRQMTDGDVSLILQKVTINDTGIYECRVRRKRAVNRITTIYLEVSPSGRPKATAPPTTATTAPPTTTTPAPPTTATTAPPTSTTTAVAPLPASSSPHLGFFLLVHLLVFCPFVISTLLMVSLFPRRDAGSDLHVSMEMSPVTQADQGLDDK